MRRNNLHRMEFYMQRDKLKSFYMIIRPKKYYEDQDNYIDHVIKVTTCVIFDINFF